MAVASLESLGAGLKGVRQGPLRCGFHNVLPGRRGAAAVRLVSRWRSLGSMLGRPGGELGAVVDVELGEDVFEVGLDGRSAHHEALGDLGVGEAFAGGGHDAFLGGVRLAQPVLGRLRSPRARRA